MKKVIALTVLVVTTLILNACTDTDLENIQKQNEKATSSKYEFIDPEKDCPENDRNCNGVPDDQE